MQVVVTDLLQLALAKGEVDEITQSRIVCCRIFGAIAPLLERQDIEQTFLQKAMSLCQVLECMLDHKATVSFL